MDSAKSNGFRLRLRHSVKNTSVTGVQGNTRGTNLLYPLYAHFSLFHLSFPLTYSKRGTGERVYYRGPFTNNGRTVRDFCKRRCIWDSAVPLYPACPSMPHRTDPAEGRATAPRTSPPRHRAGRSGIRAEPHNRKSRNCNFRITPEIHPESLNEHATDASINAGWAKMPLCARRAVRTHGFTSESLRALLGAFFARFSNRAPHRLQTPRNTPENTPLRRPNRPGRNTTHRT